MSKDCTNCNIQDTCPKFDTVDANKCEDYTPTENHRIVEDIIENMRRESVSLLKSEVPDYTNIEDLIHYLRDKSVIAFDGRMRPETPVNKEALRLASAYLQDYFEIMSR